jgi:hypothetical protein
MKNLYLQPVADYTKSLLTAQNCATRVVYLNAAAAAFCFLRSIM